MLRLVLKDIRACWIFWPPAAFSYTVFLLIAFENVHAYLATGVVLAAIQLGGPLILDEFNRIDPLIAALPLTRRDIVAGRYLSAALVSGICLALFLGTAAALLAAFPQKTAHLGPLLSLRGVLGFGLPLAALIALFLPIYFRNGLGKALYRFAAVILGVSVVLSTLIGLLGPAILGPARAAEEGSPLIFFSIPSFLPSLLRKAESAMGGPLLILSAVAMDAILLLVSLRLSAIRYSRRDL